VRRSPKIAQFLPPPLPLESSLTGNIPLIILRYISIFDGMTMTYYAAAPLRRGYMTPSSSSYMHNKNILAIKHKSLGLRL